MHRLCARRARGRSGRTHQRKRNHPVRGIVSVVNLGRHAGLVPGIHVLAAPKQRKDVDGRDTPGHDESLVTRRYPAATAFAGATLTASLP
jgi:hypothetical protein